MASISRYDVPAQADFKSTYVPIPFDEMMQIGEKTAARREQGLLMADELSASLQDFPVAPGADEAWYQENIKGLESTVDEAVQTLDPGSYEFRRKIMGATRKQTRDPNWRLAKQNYDRYWEARKQLQENADLPAANRRELENYIDTYQEQGFKGMGAFQAPGVRPYNDYYDYLNKKGQGFRTSGIEQGYLNEDGTLKMKSKRSGVHVSRVANEYGYSYDPDAEAGAELTLDRIPGSFVGSPEGQQMMLEAQDMSRYNGRSPEENFADLYVNTTLPLVNKYSGMQISDDVNMTSLGTKRAQEDVTTEHILGTLSGKIKNNIGAGKGFSEEGGFAKMLSIVSPKAKNFIDKAISGIKPKEGRTLEDSLTDVEKAFNPDTYGDLSLAQKFALKTLGTATTEMVKYIYNVNAPNEPSEDYLTVAQETMKAAGIEGRWEDLDREQKNAVHKLTAEYRQAFWDKDTHVNTEIPSDPKKYADLKKQMATNMFGAAADNGQISGKAALSGGLAVKKIIDPENPNIEDKENQLSLNDVISEDSTIEYMGRTSYDNPYGPGLHTIMVDGKEYFTYWSEEDKLDDIIPYNLYDFKRNPAGLGHWFPLQGYYVRGVERDKEQAVELLTKEQYEAAVASGQISKEGRGKATEAKTFTAGQGQNVVDIFNTSVLEHVSGE